VQHDDVEGLSLVRRVADTVHRRLPNGAPDVDDLAQEGWFGLRKARERFDEKRGVPFEIFARQHVWGAIMDFLRAEDWVPRVARGRAKAVTETRLRLQAEGGPVDAATLADELGWPLSWVETAINDASCSAMTSLDASRGQDATPLRDALMGDPEDDPEVWFEHQADLASIWGAVARLPERERTVVHLCLVEGERHSQVATLLGVHPTRISQLLRQAVGRMRLDLGLQAMDARRARTPTQAA